MHSSTRSITCCSILDSGNSDYEPLYIAARMGALGGPIGAFLCVLLSSSLSQETAVDPLEPIEIANLRRKINTFRKGWGLVTPYVIGILGGPIGSAILRALNLTQSIPPIAAVKATAVGGIFATSIYYVFGYLLACLLQPCLSDPDEAVAEERVAAARPVAPA